MAFAPDLDQAVNIVAGLLFVVLAVVVLRVAPRDRANLAFAVFCGAFGARVVILYGGRALTPDDVLVAPMFFANLAAHIATVAGLGLLAAWFPRPIRWREDRPWRGALPVLLLGLLAVATTVWVPYPSNLGVLTGTGPGDDRLDGTWVVGVALTAVNFAFPVVLAMVATRFLAASPGGKERAQVVLLTVAFAAYAGVVAGPLVVGRTELAVRVVGALYLASMAGIAALWLRNSARSTGRDRAAARRTALFVLAAALGGMVIAWAVGGFPASTTGFQWALVRGAMVLVVAYAVVRHQLLGIDLKIRWTIKQSTVAAAFIAVFFVVSEAAQEVFSTGGGLGSYVGIAAAGLLVFAIAPLQRAAERVATAAVPRAPARTARSGAEDGSPAATYLRQARVLWSDGRLDPKERAALALLRADLGLDAEEAERLELEASTLAKGTRRRPPKRRA